MLVKPTMESLLKKVESRYTLTILAAKRARQLVNGALPLSTSDTPNFVTLACEEIGKGRIVGVKGIHDIYIPLRPEIAAERLAARAAIENARLQESLEENFSKLSMIEADDGDDEIILEIEEDLTVPLDEDLIEIDALLSKFIPSETEVVEDMIDQDDDLIHLEEI